VPKSKPQLFLNPAAWEDLRRVPGNIRRKIITEIDKLENHRIRKRPPYNYEDIETLVKENR
jgi:phage-related protein